MIQDYTVTAIRESYEVKKWGRMKEKLLTGALALCLAAGVAPIEALAEEVSSGLETRNVMNMGGMFYGCSSLTTLTAPKSLGTKETALPGTFVDQEGNRTDNHIERISSLWEQ